MHFFPSIQKVTRCKGRAYYVVVTVAHPVQSSNPLPVPPMHTEHQWVLANTS